MGPAFAMAAIGLAALMAAGVAWAVLRARGSGPAPAWRTALCFTVAAGFGGVAGLAAASALLRLMGVESLPSAAHVAAFLACPVLAALAAGVAGARWSRRAAG